MKNIRNRIPVCNTNSKESSILDGLAGEEDFDTRIAMIQELIPIGLMAVNDILQQEVARLAGARYSRKQGAGDIVRWGSQSGSVYLDDKKVKIRVPRVRNKQSHQEVALSNYRKLQEPLAGDKSLLGKVLHGLSCHKYAQTASLVPEVFGLSASSVSKRFIKASARKLKEFNARRLEKYDFIAIIIDGKTFAQEQMVIAVGIAISGRKTFLGFVQTATENASVCKEFLHSLIDRGLLYEQGLLFIIDGSKGIRKAIKDVFGSYALMQRCQWHKRENVVSYLTKSHQATMRKQLQEAYEQPTYDEAFEALQQCRRELSTINKSAVASLDEGLEETLTLHRLGVFPQLGISLKTTNCLESINAQLSHLLRRITYWKNSDQKHRWLASALLAIEPNLRRIKGYSALPQLRKALQKTLNLEKPDVA